MDKKTPLRILAWPAGQTSEQNPYVRMMYEAFRTPDIELLSFTPLMPQVPAADVFHVHWPEGIFEGRAGSSSLVALMKAVRVLASVRRIRQEKGIFVLTAHNIAPHAKLNSVQRMIWKLYFSRLLMKVDVIISLSSNAMDEFYTAHRSSNKSQGIIIPHPHYRSEYEEISKERARAHFQLGPELILGIIGTLRPSKGVAEAIKAFRKCRKGDERLLIMGACDEDYRVRLEAEISNDRHITFLPGELSKEDFEIAVSAIDIYLINQSGTLNSGTALLALSLNRRLIAPKVGSLMELRDKVGDGWVSLFKSPLNSSELRSHIDNLCEQSSDECDLDAFDPIQLSKSLLNSVRNALEQKRGRAPFRRR